MGGRSTGMMELQRADKGAKPETCFILLATLAFRWIVRAISRLRQSVSPSRKCHIEEQLQVLIVRPLPSTLSSSTTPILLEMMALITLASSFKCFFCTDE